MRQAVEATVGAYRRSAEERNMQIDLELPEGSCPIIGDQNRVVIAVGELVTNAIKHSPDLGLVRIALTRAHRYYRVTHCRPAIV